MKYFDREDEIYVVVARNMNGCPKLHKAMHDRFYLTPEEAWEVATRENADAGIPFWTVIAFHGQIIAEFETQEDIKEYYA